MNSITTNNITLFYLCLIKAECTAPTQRLYETRRLIIHHHHYHHYVVIVIMIIIHNNHYLNLSRFRNSLLFVFDQFFDILIRMTIKLTDDVVLQSVA